MRQGKRSQSFRVEALESREVLSAIPLTGLGLASGTIAAYAAHSHAGLQGTTHGTFSVNPADPSAGGNLNHVSAVGRFGRLGHVSVNGTLQGPGFIVAQTSGTLIVKTARGALHLNVSSPPITGVIPLIASASPLPGLAPLPESMNYTITGGTGTYAHVHGGTGTIELTWSVNNGQAASAGTVGMVFRPS